MASGLLKYGKIVNKYNNKYVVEPLAGFYLVSHFLINVLIIPLISSGSNFRSSQTKF